MIDTWPQLPLLAETPDIYHRRPVRLDWEWGCDDPGVLEHRREISEAYAYTETGQTLGISLHQAKRGSIVSINPFVGP